MEKLLTKLKNTQGILAIVLTDKKGNLLYSSSSLDASPVVLAGLIASLQGFLTEILQGVKMGDFKDTIINGGNGRIIISSLNNGNILVLFATATGNLGLIKFALSNAMEALNKVNH